MSGFLLVGLPLFAFAFGLDFPCALDFRFALGLAALGLAALALAASGLAASALAALGFAALVAL